MEPQEIVNFRRLQTIGCLALVALLIFLCAMPLLLVDLMRSALDKLNLPPSVAGLALAGIFLGSFFNLPVYRLPRREEQLYEMRPLLGVWTWAPRVESHQLATIVAINVGGCLVPLLLALWQLWFVGRAGGWPLAALGIGCAVNVAMCYRAARPVAGLGIGIPWFVSPAVSVGLTWLLLGFDARYAEYRAPIAFVAGVAGPLLGADLLHLKDLGRIPTGMLSIGGAGTFDGIVISSILAALVA